MTTCVDCKSTSGPFTYVWPDSYDHVSSDQFRDASESVAVCEDAFGCARRLVALAEREHERRMSKWRRSGSAWS